MIQKPCVAQYASDTFLRIRQETHEQYTVPKVDFPEWVLSTSPVARR